METNKKYRLVIVEDQTHVRKGLSQYFQDYDLGFEVCAVFANGADALDWLNSHYGEADVVFTDIQMPKLSGISLAKKICEREWKIKIVFLSSYRDFEYAKEALNCGVFAYLTKPIQFIELDKVFLELKAKLDEENLSNVDVYALRQELFLQILSEVYLGNLSSQKMLMDRLNMVRFDDVFIRAPYGEIIFKRHIDSEKTEGGWQYGDHRFDNFILNTLRSEKVFYHAVLGKKDFLHILAFPKSEELCREPEAFWTIVEQETVDSVRNIQEIIDVAITRDQIIRFDSLLDLWNSRRSIKVFAENEMMTNHLPEKMHNDIERALVVINENYNKEISLADVAEKVCLPPFSFSRLFKDYTGKYFTDYLIQIRIEKAKEAMLNSNRTIKEIGESVGYRDEKYFMRLFKKKTGFTPNEFRKKEVNSVE